RVPIILVTALDSREDLIHGLNAGADEFLAKPVNGPELRARIRSMLRIKQQHDRLRSTLKLRRDLANMIVHDMRVPLGAIMLYCQLMRQRGKLGPEDRTDLEVIDSQARRMDAFVNDMLQIAKMEGGKLILQKTRVRVNDLVDHISEVHSAVAESRGVHLHFDLPEEAPYLELDASLFDRVLDNLLSNALKVSRSGQTVRLKVHYPEPEEGVDGPTLHLQVLDEGPGIPEDQRDLIFDMFKVVELSEPEGLQFGLGLTFARQVVEAHGGRLWMEPNEPQGSIFHLQL
ncbi:MAG: hybrid sensor histidine kinase/response regulator, partial [Acidobacteria bacterium]|nr:hybrid sensor histidine kinase/response regulator [Acidobacteriota bacterium]